MKFLRGILPLILFILVSVGMAKEHPCTFIMHQEAVQIKQNLNQLPLLKQSFEQTKKMVDQELPGNAGGRSPLPDYRR